MAWVRLHGYTSRGKVAYVDRTGNLAIAPQFAEGGDFHDGLARVVLDGQCYVVEEDGSRQSPPSVPSASSCGGVPDFVIQRCREGFVDKTGTVKFEFEGARDFSEHLAGVSINGKWGFVGTDGDLVIKPQFDHVLPFLEGLAAVRQGGKWGYINPSGVFVIPPRFAQADSFSDGLAKVDGGFVNPSGSLVLSGWDTASLFVQGLAHVNLGGNNYGYIDKNGKVVFRYTASNDRWR